MSDIDQIVGRRLHSIRQSLDIDVADAACALKISVSEYLASEQGERRFSAHELFKLSRLFDVPFDKLFDFDLLPKD